MANNDEITSVQSFTERTLKYGRNLMAVTVPIFVFALVPVPQVGRRHDASCRPWLRAT